MEELSTGESEEEEDVWMVLDLRSEVVVCEDLP